LKNRAWGFERGGKVNAVGKKRWRGFTASFLDKREFFFGRRKRVPSIRKKEEGLREPWKKSSQKNHQTWETRTQRRRDGKAMIQQWKRGESNPERGSGSNKETTYRSRGKNANTKEQGILGSSKREGAIAQIETTTTRGTYQLRR